MNRYLTYCLFIKKEHLSQSKLDQLLTDKIIRYYFYVLDKTDPEERWFIVFVLNKSASLEEITKIFCIQESDIDKSYKQNNIMLYVKEYCNEDIHANFDWKTRLELYDMNIHYNDFIESNKILYRLAALEGIPLKKIKSRNPLAYKRDKSIINKFHIKYIEDMKCNYIKATFFISGDDTVKISKLSLNLAEKLSSVIEHESDDDTLFEVTTDKITNWPGLYDEQPIIIWNNFTDKEFLKAFREDRWTIRHALHPFNYKTGISFGCYGSGKSKIVLHNKIHIISSTYDYISFITRISEDIAAIEQFDWRIWFVIKINKDKATLCIKKNNKRIIVDTSINDIVAEAVENYCLFIK